VTRILVAIPCYDSKPHVLFVDNLISVLAWHSQNAPHLQIERRFLGRGMIDRVRQQAHEYALKNKFTHILWWDDDILAPVDVIHKFLLHNKQIVAGMAFQRTEPYAMCAYRHQPQYGIDNYDRYRSLTEMDIDTGLQQVTAVGTGCMLMQTDIVKHLQKPWWVWPKTAAEDIEFCVMMHKHGVKAYVDTSIHLQHLNFEPRAVIASTHKQYCKRLKEFVKMNPKFKQDPEYYKMGYLIDATE